MKISETCIQRPVLSWVLTFILVIIGLIAASRLPLLQYPKFERPFVTVETTLPGASPEIVESNLTKAIEDALAGIEGVENITSSSAVEDSKVTIEFIAGYSMEVATNGIRDRLAKNADKIPDEATKPILTQSRAEERPIMTLALTSSTLDISELADYAINDLKHEIESVRGVAKVEVLGAGQYTMHLYLDPVKLAAHKITAYDVKLAIRRHNIEKPAGKIVSKDREYLVTTLASIESEAEFNDLAIAEKEGHLVRLRDLGYAKISSEDNKTKTLFNGEKGVSMSVTKQSLANPIEVSDAVNAWIKDKTSQLPEGMNVSIGVDHTTFIKRSLTEVYKTIFEATILVILVVFAFLRSFRASIIPLVTIPVSLIGAFFVMYMLDFSINTLTLMALVLAVGLVVDDAIVILENVYRHIEMGETPYNASFKAVREISFAIIAMTLTLAAVYAPIGLAEGNIGKVFREFSLTLASAVIISGFCALTLSPMMCARLLKSGDHSKPLNAPTPPKDTLSFAYFKYLFGSDVWLEKIESFYEEKLQNSLKHRIKTSVIAVAFALFGGIIYMVLPSEYSPKEDQGTLYIEGQAPQSATLQYTERYVGQLDDYLATIDDIEKRVTQINNPTFDISIQLKKNRNLSTQQVLDKIRDFLQGISGVEGRVRMGGAGGGDKGNTVEFVLLGGSKTYKEITGIGRNMIQAVHASGIASMVTSTMRGDTQDYTITILRDKVSQLNIQPMTIAEMIDMLIRGQKVSTFKKNNKQYDVKVEVEDKDRSSPYDITNLYVKAEDRKGTLVPLSELVNVASRSGPVEIHHNNRQRSISGEITLKKGLLVGEGIEQVKAIAKDVLPSDVYLDFIGGTKTFLKESSTMYLIFGLALAFIYLIMAAQFESWIDPFIIMLSVPLSITGAVMTLALITNGSLNIYSNIGLVTLVGLITKHGIMMVDFANKRRDEGESTAEAIISASKMRLRPILMTTFAMVLGALPLALSASEGAESRRQIGWVIVGGMLIGTFFTLLVLPTMYTFFTRKERKRIPVVPQ